MQKSTLDNASTADIKMTFQTKNAKKNNCLNVSNQLQKFHGDIYWLKFLLFSPVVSSLNRLMA